MNPTNLVDITKKKTQESLLEAIVDLVSAGQTLHMIANICNKHAKHEANYWKDKNSARIWASKSKKISAVAESLGKESK